jgi:tRNA wybutosine-synthesizing protein 1
MHQIGKCSLSLALLRNMNTRTVLRITMIRDYNSLPSFLREFAELVKIANPHFIELKSYMHVGMSTLRLKRSHMLEMSEIRRYAKSLLSYLSEFRIMDESEISRIVVMQNNNRFVSRWISGYD